MTGHIHELASDWRECFARAMEAMADCRPTMDIADAPLAGGPMLWWKQNLDAAPGASVWLGASKSAWTVLGQKILAAAGIDGAEESDVKGAYLEVLRQSLSALATSVGEELEREVLATEGVEEEAPAVPRRRIIASLGQDGGGELCFCANSELLDAFPSAPPMPDPAATDDLIGLSPQACGTLSLLLDVELPVSVSFGRTQIRMQEVLKLITGSIIELDRSISEPVDVIVNNCVVARGEVVVVDGNYGVRVQEVMSRRERLQESRKHLLPLNRAS